MTCGETFSALRGLKSSDKASIDCESKEKPCKYNKEEEIDLVRSETSKPPCTKPTFFFLPFPHGLFLTITFDFSVESQGETNLDTNLVYTGRNGLLLKGILIRQDRRGSQIFRRAFIPHKKRLMNLPIISFQRCQ